MSRIAFVTCAALPALDPDDHAAVDRLDAAGVEVVAATWNDRRVDWARFDVVVLRSCWDYHHHLSEFLRWLARLESAGIRVLNPPPVVRRNVSKSYLIDLQDAGVPVIPTVLCRAGTAPRLGAILDEAGWREAVVKPAVSMTGYRTWRTAGRSPADDERELAAMLVEGDVLVQRYAFEVERGGEWSVVFIDDDVSHVVLKHPARGEFRVQHEYGGTKRAAVAPPGLVPAAESALAFFAAETLYARVDGILSSDGFQVMEVELVDPSLYFSESAPAADRFASAVLGRL